VVLAILIYLLDDVGLVESYTAGVGLVSRKIRQYQEVNQQVRLFSEHFHMV
jgi:hypothetical protein